MPCYEMRTMSVEFKAENKAMLLQALKAAGMEHVVTDTGVLVNLGGYRQIEIDLERSEAEVPNGYQDKLNEIKRAYSKQAVKTAAKKAQWAVKWQKNKATINKLNW